MSSAPQKPPLSCAQVSRPTTLFATPACAVETWLPCRALVALGILVSSSRDTWDSTLVSGLGARGKLILVGVPDDQIQLSAFPLVFGGRSIYGSLAGTAIDNEDTLAFSVLENIRPMIETVPLEQAADAYARMMQGKARFRMVLVAKDGVAPGAPLN
jgi:alcohol dehydrogenase, propanol-preferring